MGEEEAKQDQAKEEPKTEEKEELKPPSPFVLHVDLHCVGCAKKIEKSILKIRGVEGVVIDMVKNHVTIKGVVEPQAICSKIMKRTKRMAKVVSPLPAADGQPIPHLLASQVSGLTTVELIVNMHCEACALQLKRKILQMKGVRSAETELSSGKVTVTGTMDADRLVHYVYRRTKKQAQIVPQPPSQEPEKPPPQEEGGNNKPNDEEQKEEETKAAAAAEEDAKSSPQENNEAAEKKEGTEKPAEEGGEGEKKESGDGNDKTGGEEQGSGVNKGGGEEAKDKEGGGEEQSNEEQSMHKMMMYTYNNSSNNYQPPLYYFIERIPAPQLFSDENPNACCIT